MNKTVYAFGTGIWLGTTLNLVLQEHFILATIGAIFLMGNVYKWLNQEEAKDK